MEDARVIKLRSKDGDEFEIDAEAGMLSEIIKDSVGDDADESTDVVVDVMRVGTDCLRKVVEFLDHYKEEAMVEIPTPLGGSTFDEIMPQEWYRNFVKDTNISREMLFDLLTAANYMGIKPLLDLACLKVTFLLTGKNAEEIREILNLPELTPEEEAQAREEHRWIFDDNN